MRFLLLLAFMLCPHFSWAKSGYVKLPSGHSVYVDHIPAKAGKSTFVLVNGLVYNLERWDDFARPLAKEGYGIVRYYFRGQLLSLKKEIQDNQGKNPEFFSRGLEPEDFAQELKELMDALKLKKAHVVGLSYGAGIAAHFADKFPQYVDQLIFQAPLVIPLDQYDPNGAWIHWNLEAMRLYWGPLWGPYVYDYYYDMIYRSYLNDRIVPERIPPEMQDMPEAYKESVFHLVRAMRRFDLRRMSFSPLKNSVHVMLASEEEAPALKDQFRAWNAFGKSQASLVYFTPSWHAIPDAVGEVAALLSSKIAQQETMFKNGRVYYWNLEGKKGLEPMKDAQTLEARIAAEKK